MKDRVLPDNRLLWLCGLATLFDGYDLQILGLSLPGMSRSLGVAPAALAPALSCTLAGAALGAMALAPLADRRGRRFVLIAAMLLMAIPSLGIAFTSSIPVIAALRLVTGIGLGAAVPVALALAAECAPPARRNLFIAIVSAAAPVGALLASLLAPWIEEAAGWRALFLIGAILPAMNALLFRIGMPASRQGAVPAATGGPASPAPLFANGMRRNTLLFWLLFSASLFASSALVAWLPTLLVTAGWVKADAQRTAGLLAMGGLIGGLSLGWLGDRIPLTRAVTAAYAGAAFGAALFVFHMHQAPVWLVVVFMVGAGLFGSQAVLGAVSASLYPTSHRSTGLGWASGVGRVVAVAGPLAVGALLDKGAPPQFIIAALAMPLTVCALAAALLRMPPAAKSEARP